MGLLRTQIVRKVQNQAGSAIANANATIYSLPDNSLATVYTSETGTATYTQPLQSGLDGSFAGWLELGDYSITIASSAGTSTSRYYANHPQQSYLETYGDDVPLTVKAGTALTSNMAEWKNASGTTVMSVSTAGSITSPTVTAIQGSVTAVDSSLGSALGTIGTNTAAIGSVSGTVGTAVTNISNLNSSLGSVAGTVSTNTAAIGSVSGTVSTNTTDISNLQGTVTGIVNKTGNLTHSYLQTPRIGNVGTYVNSIALGSNDSSYYYLTYNANGGVYNYNLAYTTNDGVSFTFPNGTAGTGLPKGNAMDAPGKIACSSNGSVIYHTPTNGTAGFLNIYKSTNSGTTFAATTSSTGNWGNYPIVCSSSGSVVYAVRDGNALYYSQNVGSTWSLATLPSFTMGTVVQGLTCSDDGSIAYFAPGHPQSDISANIYKTTNSGASWSTVTAAGVRKWTAISCSSNGSTVIAASSGGTSEDLSYLYLSKDAGASWSTVTAAGLDAWTHSVVSGDGNYIVAKGAVKIVSSSNSGTTFYVNSPIQSLNFSPQKFGPSGSSVVGVSNIKAHKVSF